LKPYLIKKARWRGLESDTNEQGNYSTRGGANKRKMRVKKDPRQKELEATIGGIVMRVGKKELAKRTGIGYTTLCRRCKDVGTLTARELWLIQDADR